MRLDKCEECQNILRACDVRLRAELQGICLDCAAKSDFAGMTDAQKFRCQNMIQIVEKESKMTRAQKQHLKDMGR